MKSLTEAVTSRDEFAVYGEHVANKLRNSGRSRIEISLAQREIDIFLKLEMGMYGRIGYSNVQINTPLHVTTPPIHSSPSPSYSANSNQSFSSDSSFLNTLTSPQNFETPVQNSETTQDQTIQVFLKNFK